ncbi:MAG: signal peptidase I [Deltaproteobacteria bacterium GWA2_45_12]|nr:MAG: signal peptidase I [Deltaproteobacteria bacterium GWA2_45_12]
MNSSAKKKGVVREYVEALLVAVLLAFVIRSFLIEPYKIPSKSMVPTLLVGDHIFVNKLAYGWRIPGTKKWLTYFGEPTRGEVMVFIYPEDEKLDFIKRVVGLPGDHIRMTDNKLYINDVEITNQDIEVVGINPQDKRNLLLPEAKASELPKDIKGIPFFRGYSNYQIKLEDMIGSKHLMQRSKLLPNNDSFDLTVPADTYFVMGDNRDQSADSRVWGFVPRKNLKGRAIFIWLSLDSDLGGVRFKRFGKKII